ncbi:MAG: hypothetical protein R6U39_01295 [Candidatus Aegiribacteria sp.]
MNWKVEVAGDSPSEASVQVLAQRTGLALDSILLAFSRGENVVCRNLSESEAQALADRLKRDPGVTCRVLPDSDSGPSPTQLFRVLLVNYRPGYRTRLRRRLQELTRLPQEQVINWLSRMPFVLSGGVDSETARKIKRSVTEAGGIVRIETETPFQESLTARKRSNAVFSAGQAPAAEDVDASDALFRREPKAEPEAEEEAPPVVGLPEGHSFEPPPLDSFETDGGTIIMSPPSRYTPGAPDAFVREDFRRVPPVLPEQGPAALPQVLEFSPPDAPPAAPPPVVGSREHSGWADEPAPDVVLLHPPPARVDAGMLLPPVLSHGGDEDEDMDDETFLTNLFRSPGRNEADQPAEEDIREEGSLKLLLCRPSSGNEERVAKALRDVMGISPGESRELMRKAPVLLREYSNHARAILTVHQLESRGVTVSLDRRDPESVRGPTGSEGFRAWLARNG